MAYFAFHMKKSHATGETWDPKAVTEQTPHDIRQFILQKCGDRAHGYEGCKV